MSLFVLAVFAVLLTIRVAGPMQDAVVVVGLVVFTPILADLALLAIGGGGLTVTPRGLDFRFDVRARELIPWSAIASVDVEMMSGGPLVRSGYRWLVIGLETGSHAWPWSFQLAGSGPDRLRISPLLLPRPTDVVAAEIAAIVAAARSPS